MSRGRRIALTGPALLVVALLAAGGCSASDSTHAGDGPVTSASTPSLSGSQSDGTPTAKPTSDATRSHGTPDTGTGSSGVTKLLTFVVENHSADQMRSQMPYVWSLAQRYGYASDYRGLRHPSLPNYLAIAGGSMFGVADNDPPSKHRLSGPSVFGAAIRAGKTATLYAEAMSTPCQQEAQGTYAVKHNPWAYFADERSLCEKHNISMQTFSADVSRGDLPAVGMVIPDLCNDAHDCPLSQADQWFQTYVGQVLAGPDWKAGRLAVVITADEDDGHHGNQILTVVAHPDLSGAVVTTPLDHYALSRSYSEVAGTEPLGLARSAASLLGAFGLPVE